MKKQKITIAVAVFVMTIMVLNVGFASSSPDSYVQSQALVFLEQVSGINVNDCEIISLNVTTAEMPTTQTPQTGVSGIINYKGTNYSLAMAIVDEKIWFYKLEPISNNIVDTKVSPNYCLTIAKTAITNYQKFFNASHCNEFVTMVPATIDAANTTVDKDNTQLVIAYSDSTNQLDYVTLSWFEKVGGISLPAMSTEIIVSQSGLVVSFVDNLAIHKVVTTQVDVSETQAIDAAMLYIEAYATKNNQKVASVNATFQYSVDVSASRSDSYSIYPRWAVFAEFDKTNEQNVNGYGVMMWADNGKVYHHEPQGFYTTITQRSSPNLLYPISVAAIAFVAALGIALQVKRRAKNHYSYKMKSVLMVGSVLITMVLICATAVPMSHADASTILGSRYDISSEELTADTNAASAIASYSSSAGYTTYNWYGSSTTDSNIIIAAYGQDQAFASAFYIGHGNEISETHYWGWPWQYHDHSYRVITEDDGTVVRDHNIWDLSVDENPSGEKVVFLWSCRQAEDAIGSMVNYPCGDAQEHGMPLAWDHESSLSTDGYGSPDTSGQIFIGFEGSAPFLTFDGLGVNNAGQLFVYQFYYGALMYGYTVNGALNYAAQQVWSVNYNSQQCLFYSGYDSQGVTGIMKVFGQGTIYM